jgi:hypothetical protein
MSKLFGSRPARADDGEDQLPLLSQLTPEVEAVAQRLAALALPQLAAEVMTNAFTADFEPGPDNEPGQGLTEITVMVETFLPPHGEFTGPVWKAPARSAAEYRIRDMVSDAVQILEHACLVKPSWYESNGNWTNLGYVTTRLGRAALADGSVERLAASVVPS